MRSLLALLLLLTVARAAEPPFEILPGDRVLFLGDTLLEREGTYGYLETRMHEQFADRAFTVRNLSWAGDTPLGLSRASFDPPAKGWERLREQIAGVKPTVVFLGYGMAASLQQLTEQSQDPTLNADPARYGAEPMTATRFKKELGELMDAIGKAEGGKRKAEDGTAAAPAPGGALDPSAAAGDPPGAPGSASPGAPGSASPGAPGSASPGAPGSASLGKNTPSTPPNEASASPAKPAPTSVPGGSPGTALGSSAPPGTGVRFVLLSPIRHEDLRATRPGLPDPAAHNTLLAEYAKAIEELAQERGARFVNLAHPASQYALTMLHQEHQPLTANGIHLTERGYQLVASHIGEALRWSFFPPTPAGSLAFDSEAEVLGLIATKQNFEARLLPAVIKKNELFFHQFRPANSTYLTGFRKHEQGQNAKEMPMFDPLIAAAEAEIDRLKRLPAGNGQKEPLKPTSSVPDVYRNPQNLTPSVGGEVSNPPKSSPNVSGGVSNPPKSSPNVSGEVSDPPKSSPSVSGEVPNPPKSFPSVSGEVSNPLKSSPSVSGEVSNPPKSSPSAGGGVSDPRNPTSSAGGASPRPALPTFTVADGYQIELWAENPLLEKPTQMNWDALGRLWVCSSSLYPMIAPGQVADDKILILSDPERTGKATRSEVFAKGLLIPTGVVPDLAQVERRTSNVEHQTSNDPTTANPPVPNAASDASTFNVQRSTFDVSHPAYGAYVGQSTELLHFSPTGEKRIILSGFGTEDTHHIIHTLRWGPDGRLYFNQSIYIHSHLETPWGLVRLNSGGCLAYDPRTERVEVFAKGWINSWGHAWDRWGQSFFTDGAGGGGINWAFPGATFVTYEGARQTIPGISPGSYPKFAGLELIYSPHFPADWQGNAVTCDFRAHRIVRFAITDLATPSDSDRSGALGGTRSSASRPGGPPPGPASPKDVQEPVPPTARADVPLSGYTTKEMPDLVRTSDLSFRPIDVKLGPDGALYVADWSNPVINHGEVDFRDPRRDKHMGRIWRISKKGGAVVKWEPLVGKKNTEVLPKLVSENLWEKEQARRVLSGRDPNKVFAEAVDTSFRAKPETLLEYGRLCAVAADLFSPSELDRAVERAAKVRLRSTSIASSPARPNVFETESKPYPQYPETTARYIADPNPRVRLEAMRALARIPTARSAELVLDAAVGVPGRVGVPPAGSGVPPERSSAAPPTPESDTGTAAQLREGGTPSPAGGTPTLPATPPDVFYQHAAWLSINDLAQPWLAALADGTWKPEGRERQLEFALNALPPATAGRALAQVLGPGPRDFAQGPWAELIGRAGDPAALRQLFDALLVSFGTHCCGDEIRASIDAVPIDDGTALRAVNALLEAARVRNLRPTGDLLPLERLVFHTNADLRTSVLRLVGYWKPAPALDWLRGVFEENALDPTPAAAAIESARAIGGAEALALLKKLAVPGMSAPIRQRAAVALAALDPKAPEVATALAAAPNEDVALATWRDLFKTPKAIDALAANVPADLPKPVAIAGVRAAREAGKKGEALLAALTPFAGNVPKPAPAAADFKAIAARMWTQGGDAAQGELIYRRANLGCVTCHAIGGAGGIVGPSLTSLGASAPADYIIESMLAPNAKVKEGYHGVTLELKDGTEVMGIAARETAQEVILRNVAGQETAVPKAHITGQTDIGSIMPAGLLDALNDNERMNLYCFLAELGKPGPFDASKANAARVWRLYPGTATDLALKGAASDASATAFTLVDGRLTKAQLTEALQLVNNPGETIYAVTQFQSSGQTLIGLTNSEKSWIDGQVYFSGPNVPELRTQPVARAVNLPAGLHTLTIQLTVKSLPDFLQATSPDASFLAP